MRAVTAASNDGSPHFRDQTLAAFVDALASAAPVPGGGAAAAVAASFAAGLVRMVAALSLGRPRCGPYEETLRRADEAARAVDFLALADADAAAYGAFVAALKLPRETAGEQATRGEAARAAAREAALVPLRVVRACRDLLVAVESIAGRSNLNARSDVATAATLAEAAAQGAGANVTINLPAAGDEAFAGEATAELVGLLNEIEDLGSRARARALGGGLRDPEDG